MNANTFVKKLKKGIAQPRLVMWFLLNRKCIASLIADRTYLKLKYRAVTKKSLNLENPKTFNEKVQWLKINNRKSEYPNMVDKYAVREYISQTIGEKYLIPMLGIWESPDEIDFDALPDQFVLKCTHNSGLGMYICKDKRKLDISAVKKDLKKGLRENHFITTREWPNKDISPRIIAEEYIVDESGVELKDYKFFCFNGKVELIEVDFDRFENHKRNLYTPDWQFVDETIEFPNDKNRNIEKPRLLDEMIEIAQKLSSGMSMIRIDLYHTEDKVYFGEITFSPDSGWGDFSSEELNLRMGELIKINSEE